MRGLRHLRQRGDDPSMAGPQPLVGIADPHAFMVSVLVQERERFQIKRIALGPVRQFQRCKRDNVSAVLRP